MGGHDLTEIPLEELYDQIAYVSQDNYLFDDTVRENIRMGRRDATDAEVEAAAHAAGCDNFISELEHGYETNVGGGGAHLSGGERQRIAIARAMLQPGRLLLLDEPTAAMGIRESHQTMQLLRRLRQEDHTLLIVSHDIYQVFDVADRIFVMRAGRCIADIMAKNSSPEELHHLILEREQGVAE